MLHNFGDRPAVGARLEAPLRGSEIGDRIQDLLTRGMQGTQKTVPIALGKNARTRVYRKPGSHAYFFEVDSRGAIVVLEADISHVRTRTAHRLKPLFAVRHLLPAAEL